MVDTLQAGGAVVGKEASWETAHSTGNFPVDQYEDELS